MNAIINDSERTRKFFNKISFIYAILSKGTSKNCEIDLNKLNLPNTYTVLDLCTGNGGMANEFYKRGHKVKGIDISENLLKLAKKNTNIEFELMDLNKLNSFPDKSFDIVNIGFALHGFSKDFRMFILKQMARISRQAILVIDFTNRRRFITTLVERLEGPYYEEYVKYNRKDEFKQAGLEIISDNDLENEMVHYWFLKSIQ